MRPSQDDHAVLSSWQAIAPDLVEEKRLGRVPLARHFLYVSAKRGNAKAQIARRQEGLEVKALYREEEPPFGRQLT